MAIAQPSSSDPLNSPDHSALHRVIAADPSAPVQSIAVSSTGLTEISNLGTVLNANTFTGGDIGAQINAAYAALPSAGGAITVESGSYTFTTPITFTTNGKYVSLRGSGASATFLKYSPTSGNAITINFGDPTGHLVSEMTGFTLMGKSSLVAGGQANTNTSIGIYYGGANGCVGINTHDTNVNGFGSNWEIGSNAYMLNFQNNSNSGGNGGQTTRGSLVQINTASNSGERNVFSGNNFTDPGNSDATLAIYIASGATASNFFSSNSIDNAQVYIVGSNGETAFVGNHFENPGAPSSYAQYIPIYNESSDRSTQITVIGNEFANSASNVTWDTIIKHGGQLYAAGNHINNYNNSTISAFVDHSNDNGVATDYIVQTQVQGGTLTNLVAGSGGVAYSLATGNAAVYNVGNSYTIGLRANSSNTNEFFSGSSTTATYDHGGNWTFGVSGSGGTSTFYGKIANYNSVSTAGWGVPAIYGSGRVAAQTSAAASITTYTVGAADGSFIVSGNVLITTSTTHSFTMTCAYTDEGNTARTLTLSFSNVAGTIGTTIANGGGAVPYEGIPMRIRCKSGTTITLATTGTFTSVTYNAEGSIIQIA